MASPSVLVVILLTDMALVPANPEIINFVG